MPGQVHTKVTLPGTTGAAGYSPIPRTGTGVPSSGLGNNNDMYLDTATGNVYGPKASGLWGSVVANILGPQGLQGIPGIGYTPRGAYASGTTYAQGDQVTDGSPPTLWWSLVGTNIGNTPSLSPTKWVGLSGSFTGVPQKFTATASQTVFTPTVPPSTSSMVYVNRGLQYLGGSGVGDYQISGVTVVFNAGLPVGTIVVVIS